MESGHRWIGSGGARKHNADGGKHGVGILIGKKWASSVIGVRAVNARLIYVDMQIGRFKFRMICADMPHGGYPDKDIEIMYSNIDEVIDTAHV